MRVQFGRLLAVATLASGLWGCPAVTTSLTAGEACRRTEECGDGLACVAGVCGSDISELVGNGQVPERDAGGTPDASPPLDGAMPDGSKPDASMPDSSMPDSSMPDSSTPDSSMPDSSMPDGSTDASMM